METRIIVAYGLMAFMGLAAALWLAVSLRRRRESRRIRRGRRPGSASGGRGAERRAR